MDGSEVEVLPVVTGALLRDADTLCPLRLDLAHRGIRGNWRGGGRFRVPNALREAVLDAHDPPAEPARDRFVAPDDLWPEERVVYDAAADHYVALFAGRLVRTAGDLLDGGARLPRRGVVLRAAPPIVVEGDDGVPELRRLDLRGRSEPPCADPAASWELLVAALVLACAAPRRPLRLCDADLVGGRLDAVDLDPSHLEDLGALLDDRIALLRARAAEPTAVPGTDCGQCDWVARCPAHRGGA